MAESNFPSFFADAPVLRLCDPLAALLGATSEGRLDYRYEDAVRLAGHSCPTVAGAFLMVRAALRELYGCDVPRRGEIGVDLREKREAGVAGVVGAVASLLTGAAESGGFRGLAGRFVRRDTLRFGQPLAFGQMRLRRLDNAAAVEVSACVERVSGDPRIGELLPRCVSNQASDEERRLFTELWQQRVRRLLIEHADDEQVIVVHRALPQAPSRE